GWAVMRNAAVYTRAWQAETRWRNASRSLPRASSSNGARTACSRDRPAGGMLAGCVSISLYNAGRGGGECSSQTREGGGMDPLAGRPPAQGHALLCCHCSIGGSRGVFPLGRESELIARLSPVIAALVFASRAAS